MRQALVATAVVLVILAVAMPAYCKARQPALYSIGPAEAPPRIDGRLDDPCWQVAPRMGPFALADGKTLPAQQTYAWAACDDRALYIAFECLEDRMADLAAERTARDSDVWRDDCVEVFVAPARGRERYFHFVVNSNGAQYDARGKLDAGWDAEWQAGAARESDRWTAEVALPFAGLGVGAPDLLEAWRFNLTRHERPHNEVSALAPVGTNFHAPERFADLVFGGPQAVIVSVMSPGGLFLGSQEAQARVRNLGAEPARVVLWAEVQGIGQSRVTARIAPGGGEVVTVPYEVRTEGDLSLVIKAADASGRSLLRSAPLHSYVEPNQERLAEISRTLEGLREPAGARGLSNELEKLQTDAARLLSLAQDRERWARAGRSEWQRLASVVERLDWRASRLRLRAATADPESGYAIGVETPLRKIRPDKPYRGPVGVPAEVWLCRNEYEPVQVVVLALGEPLERVRAYATDLVGPGGARIRDHHVTPNLVGFVHTRRPPYEVEYVGWHPDPLMEMAPFDVKADGAQPIWITVFCPSVVPAGDYTGEIVIKPDNAAETRVPLIAHVWDFALPEQTHIKTAFALSEREIARWYGYDRVPDDVRLRYYDFLLRRRINPTDIYSSTPAPAAKDMAFCVSRGLNAFNIRCLRYSADPRERRAQADDVCRYAQFLKEQGWFEGAYIYGFDEVRPDDYRKLREVYGVIGDACPDLPRACAVAPNDQLRDYVDIWVPLTAHYDHETARRYRAAGDEVWWYICCGPHHPYANWFVDYPATDPRVLFWMNWKYGANGFLYHALNMWHSNRAVDGLPEYLIAHDDPAARAAIAAGKRWPQVPWNTFTYSDFNGDGHLIYPGPDGRPLSSMRLECIRDGIEDYEYFHLLSELTAALEGPARYDVLVRRAKALLGVEPWVVTSLTRYTRDPEMILRARRDLAEHIEKMSRAARG